MYRGSQVRIEETLGGDHNRQPWHRTPNRGWHSSWTDTRGGPIKVLLRRLGEQTRGGRERPMTVYYIQVGYVLGIGWKLFQIYRGNYTPEEPVYLKYK